MTPTRKRIVVTGLGAMTPIGRSVAEFWRSLLAAQSGVAPITAFPAAGARPSYAAEVKQFDPERVRLPRRKSRLMGRHAQLAFAAVQEACADAGFGHGSQPDPARLGVILGIGMLNADVTDLGRAFHAVRIARVHEDRRASETDSVDLVAFGRTGAPEMFPLWLLRHIPNLASAHVSIEVDAQGPSNTITTGCVAGANAIGEAARTLARGDADVMLAGGTDARISPLAMLRYRDLGWLSTRDEVDPAAVSAPFDEGASGFVNGEGAGILVLESLDHARARGARIYAELAGYAAANDAYELLRPHPEGRGLARAAVTCLARSSTSADATDVVFSPAPSVPAFDRAVASALTKVFPADRKRPAITATRSIVGHSHAASAALDCIAAVKAIADARLPPTMNLRRPIADLPFVTGAARAAEISTALVWAYGFGGHGAAIAVRRYLT